MVSDGVTSSIQAIRGLFDGLRPRYITLNAIGERLDKEALTNPAIDARRYFLPQKTIKNPAEMHQKPTLLNMFGTSSSLFAVEKVDFTVVDPLKGALRR